MATRRVVLSFSHKVDQEHICVLLQQLAKTYKKGEMNILEKERALGSN